MTERILNYANWKSIFGRAARKINCLSDARRVKNITNFTSINLLSVLLSHPLYLSRIKYLCLKSNIYIPVSGWNVIYATLSSALSSLGVHYKYVIFQQLSTCISAPIRRVERCGKLLLLKGPIRPKEYTVCWISSGRWREVFVETCSVCRIQTAGLEVFLLSDWIRVLRAQWRTIWPFSPESKWWWWIRTGLEN